MQDPEHGVPVRSQKLFFTDIPAAFMGELSFNQQDEVIQAPTVLHNMVRVLRERQEKAKRAESAA